MVLNYLNLFVSIYVGKYMPLMYRKTNRIEIMNEIFVTLATYNVMFFTEFTNPEVRFTTGYWFCAIMVLQMLANFLIVGIDMARIVKLTGQKWVKRIRHRRSQKA